MSYNFEDVCNFKIGERYWECNQHGCIHFEVTSTPSIRNDKVWFNAVDLDTNEEIPYLLTNGLEHYGPKIYNHKAYMTIDELQGKDNT
mgnify:CR=1 FL=1